MSLLGKIMVKLGWDNSEFNKGEKDAEKGVNNFGDKIKSMATKAAAAIGVLTVLKKAFSFGKEAYNAAAQAEGVERAFKRLNNPNLLNQLREATQGTVSDLELMQNAIQAKNFKIPLENLASYLKFANQRAKETGQSVDYLVQSIVLGVGRKSPLILDNLGISALEVREEFAKTGDMAKAVANIIEREMGEAGDVMEGSKEKIARVSSAWANFKRSVGDAGWIKAIGDAWNETLSGTLNAFTALSESKSLKWWQKLLGYIGSGQQQLAAFEEQWAKTASEQKVAKAVEESMKLVKSVKYAKAVIESIDQTKGTDLFSQMYRSRLVQYVANMEAAAAENERLRNTREGIERELSEKKERLASAKLSSPEEKILLREIAALEKKLEVKKEVATIGNKGSMSFAENELQELEKKIKFVVTDKERIDIQKQIDDKKIEIKAMLVVKPKTERQDFEDQIKTLEQQQLDIPSSIGAEQAQKQWGELQTKIDAVKATLETFPKTVPPAGSLAAYDNQLSEIADKLPKVTTDQERYNLALQQLELQMARDSIAASADINNLQTKADLLKDLADKYRDILPLLSSYYSIMGLVAQSQADAAKSGKETAKEVVDFGSQLSSQLGSTMASSFSSLFEGLFSGDEEQAAEEKTQAILRPFAQMVTQLGEYAIAMGVAGIAIKSLITNPYTAIAAGIALVALGKLAEAGVASITSGNGSSQDPNTFTGGYSYGNNNSAPANPEVLKIQSQQQTIVVKGEVSGGALKFVLDKEAMRKKA